MTDEERSEVAAELRELAEYYEKVPAWDVIAAGELPAPVDDALMACGLGRAVHATEICGRLADLIEPEERTCHMVSDHLTDTAYCSVCGERFDSVAPYMAMVQLPYSVTDYEPEYKYARYCPNCGAKVIQE